jgi:hypothetical protein
MHGQVAATPGEQPFEGQIYNVVRVIAESDDCGFVDVFDCESCDVAANCQMIFRQRYR